MDNKKSTETQDKVDNIMKAIEKLKKAGFAITQIYLGSGWKNSKSPTYIMGVSTMDMKDLPEDLLQTTVPVSALLSKGTGMTVEIPCEALWQINDTLYSIYGTIYRVSLTQTGAGAASLFFVMQTLKGLLEKVSQIIRKEE